MYMSRYERMLPGDGHASTTGKGTTGRLPVSLLVLALILLCFPTGSVNAQDAMARAAALTDSGMVRVERGELEEARTFFAQALELSEDYFRAVLGLGRVALGRERGGERQAVDLFTEAVRLMPTSADAHYWLARGTLELARTIPLRTGNRDAMRALSTAVELNPSHPDALYRLAWIMAERLDAPRPEEARDLLIRQVATAPSHSDAWLLLLEVHMGLGEWEDAVAVAEALIGHDPGLTGTYPLLAGALWQRERFEDAMRTFESYFSVIDAEEIALYLDIGYILTPEEQREFEALDEEGRRSYRDHYWIQRDPDPKTMVNERLLEHFIRVAWARIEFGENDWPWDSRGAFYVRYGEPDIRTGVGRPFPDEFIDDDPIFTRNKRNFYESMGLSPMQAEISAASGVEGRRPGFRDAGGGADGGESAAVGNAQRTPERWVYKDRGVDVTFNDEIGRGRYQLTGTLFRQLVEQMEDRLPVMSPEEDRIEYIDPMDVVITFRGEGGKTAVEYAFALLPDEFGAFRSLAGAWTTLDIDVRMFTPAWREVASEGEKARRIETVPQVTIRGIPLFVDATRLEVDPGSHILTTMLTDPETGRRATAEERLEVPDYSGDGLMVSNILPAARITEVGPGLEGRFIRGELEVLPLPGRALQADQPLFIYYEAYNLSMDAFGATSYRIDYAVREAPEGRALMTRLFQGISSIVTGRRGRVQIGSSVTRQGIRRDLASYLEIDVSDLKPTTWELELTVTDLHTGEEQSSILVFRTLPGRDDQDRQP
ncbi:MAG: GWxTD domain-containing protein [marine benthic group bacterium]|nr:GWxTD domain-containing protein [Gemmatimonadota bacterium]